MRTIVYIDGFNLYFGCLQNTPYRWLDVSKLVSRICKEQSHKTELIGVKYFTADIKAKLSRRGNESCITQQNYLLSLKAYSPNIEIIKGKYNISKAQYHQHGEPVDFDKKHAVWRAEEKQTDVNIALHMFCDSVVDNICEQVVLFSNDSDLAPALYAIKKRNSKITIGIVAPVRDNERKSSIDLREHSDWTRNGIQSHELLESQLPNRVITRKRPIIKPAHW